MTPDDLRLDQIIHREALAREMFAREGEEAVMLVNCEILAALCALARREMEGRGRISARADAVEAAQATGARFATGTMRRMLTQMEAAGRWHKPTLDAVRTALDEALPAPSAARAETTNSLPG
jgi:hypothetical protein